MKLSPEFARFVFWLCVASCAIAQIAILASTVRGFRARKLGLTDDSAQNAPALRRAPEFFWALLPAFALVFVYFGAWETLTRTSDSTTLPAPGAPPAQPTLSGSASLLATYTLPPFKVRAKSSAVPKRARIESNELLRIEAAEPSDLNQDDFRPFEMHQ